MHSPDTRQGKSDKQSETGNWNVSRKSASGTYMRAGGGRSMSSTLDQFEKPLLLSGDF